MSVTIILSMTLLAFTKWVSRAFGSEQLPRLHYRARTVVKELEERTDCGL